MMEGQRRHNDPTMASLYEAIMSLKAEVAEIRAKVDEMDRRLTERINRLEKIVERRLNSRTDIVKWSIVVIGMVLSWLAAMYGRLWFAPQP